MTQQTQQEVNIQHSYTASYFFVSSAYGPVFRLFYIKHDNGFPKTDVSILRHKKNNSTTHSHWQHGNDGIPEIPVYLRF